MLLFLVIILFVATSGQVQAQGQAQIALDDGSICRKIEDFDQCPSGMNQVYRDPDAYKMCCDAGTKAESIEKAKAVGCRPSRCIDTGTGTGGNGYSGSPISSEFCSSSSYLSPRIIDDTQIKYDTMLEERCPTGGGSNGVTALCCPKESVDSYLVTTFGAEPNEFPHMAKLSTPEHCGGTIYNKRYIITSAHCAVDDFTNNVKPRDGMTVTLGVSSPSELDNPKQVYKVNRVIPHEGYSKLKSNNKGFGKFNDIALLKLDRDIQFGDAVKALEIAPKNFKPEDYGNEALILGWGRHQKNYQWTPLQKSNFLIRNDSVCFDTIGGYYWTMDSRRNQLLCLGGIVGNTWSPVVGKGDDGGPAICRGQSGHPVLCGITSFGPPHQRCLDGQNAKTCPPSGFVDVGYFSDWIQDNAGAQEAWTLYKPYLYGREVARVIYDHQVYLESRNGKNCGGTLISKDVVVTAGQCVFEGRSLDDMRLRDGLVVMDTRGNRFEVAKATHLKDFGKAWPRLNIDLAHDRFANSDHHKLAVDYFYKNDLAVVKLKGRVDINFDNIPKISGGNEEFSGGKEVAFTRNGDKSYLVERDYEILGREDCDRRLKRLGEAGMRVDFGGEGQLEGGLLCGAEVYSGGSTCDRELGGGLFCRKGVGGKHVLCGVQVFRLCERAYPNLFIDVGERRIREWIRKIMNKFERED